VKVAVVGAGVFGASSARALALRDCDVTLFERARVPAPDASGTDISKAIRLEYGAATARYAPLVLESMDAWRALEVETGRALYHQSGALFLASDLDEGGFERTSARQLADLGESVELVGADEAARRWPAFAWADLEGALFSPRGGWLASSECVRALVEVSGATLVEDAPVDAVGEGELSVGGETHRFDAVLVCAGAWLKRLRPRAPARITRQHITHYRPGAAPELPVWIHDISRADERGAWYGFPPNEGIVKIALHDRCDEVDPDIERVAPAGFLDDSRAFVRARIPGLDADAPLEGRGCLYANSPTGEIVVDQLAPGLFIAGCGSGHGFKLGPAVGARAARLVLDGETDFPASAAFDEVW
jgi:glycine/D-amino acid oxidase-like deaminating enzyme